MGNLRNHDESCGMQEDDRYPCDCKPESTSKFTPGDRVDLRLHKAKMPSRNNGLVLRVYNQQMVTVQWFGVAFVETDTFTYTENELELTATNSKPPQGIIENQKATEIDTAVYQPKHYGVIDDIEAIELIARSMTVEMFKGYCLGNIMKYRMRLGAKDAVEQDLKKAENYVTLFEKFKGLCYE